MTLRLAAAARIALSFVILLAAAVVLIPGRVGVCASAVSPSDSPKPSAPQVTGVNLKENDWIYSTHKDGEGNFYAVVTGYNGKTTDVKIPDSLGGYGVRAINSEAFSGNRYIVSVIIPNGVTDIGKYSFKGCVGLSSISFPDTLKSIREGAFYGCKSLKNVNLPDSVDIIGSYAFYNCWHITSIELPKSLKRMGSYAFNGCSVLSVVSFGENIESIGSMAFKGCTSLLKVSLPDSVTSLGSGAFMNCTSMKNAVIGSGVSEIHSDTFRGCSELVSVSFGKSVRTVGNSAFEGCVSLKSIALGGVIEKIGALAFYNCAVLTKAELGAHVKEIGTGAFSGCTSLSTLSVSNENNSFVSKNGILYSRDGKTLIMCPQGAKGQVLVNGSTEKISDYAFSGCDDITGINIPDSVEYIGNGAFLGCNNVTRLMLPEGLEKIGCAAIGYYLYGGDVKKASYLNVFGNSGSVAEMYCVAKGLRFISYNQTMMINTRHVVLTENDVFNLKGVFLTSISSKITWSSSDTSIAYVDKKGKLKGVSEGEAVITASAEGFDECSISVRVIRPSEDASETTESQEPKSIYLGENTELSTIFDMIIDPLLDTQKFWYSSNPAVACVDPDGRVTSHSVGTTLITCRFPDGSEDYRIVRVVEKPLEFSLKQPESELKIGDEFKLRYEIVPSISTDIITWKSDNENIAQVDKNGKVTAVGQGTCTVTAATASGLEASVKITCVVPAEAIALSNETRSVYQGKEFNLTVEYTPTQSKEKIVWTSSDPKVASVNSKGKVTGVSFGTATIYANTASGAAAYCNVCVIAKAELLMLDVKKLTLNVDTEHKINAVILPSYSPETTEKCAWSSTDENVAVVDENGMVSAVGIGTCIINCKIDGELISKCQVTVRQPAESAEILADKTDIYIGDVLVLRAKLTPENTTDKVEWSSDNTDVAYVTSKGSVKAKSRGTAIITLKVTNEVSGKSVACEYKINVLSKAESIELSRSSISMNEGGTDSLTYQLTPSDSNDFVRWHSSDESVATVRDDGLIKAVGKGSCYIYAETGSGRTAKCKVDVN
ncbi:MAG: leucine-rich repeat protein [Firmicutes bacterium]|nr:leucine-rich repeat protein [Bacillota bacterium]